MRDQPKPTDWTQEWLRQYLAGYSSYDLQLKATADAHNAALATKDAVLAFRQQNIDNLTKQLTAERDNRKREMKDYETLCGDLQRQLAAEREDRKAIVGKLSAEYIAVFNKQRDENQQLRSQLTAEREKRENSDRKWIVAAGQLRQQLADALAKIGAK